MAHYKRGKCRKNCPRAIRGSAASWRAKVGLNARRADGQRWSDLGWHPYLSMMNSYPAWWDRSKHTPQWRAKYKTVVRRILKGADPDEAVMPVWGKPHDYYW